MENNITQEMRSELRQSLKRAWVDAYHYLIPKSSENRAQERLDILKGWLEWADMGIVDDSMFSVLIGYTLAEHVIPCDFNDYGMDKLQSVYLEEAIAALREVVEFEEKVDAE